MGGQLISQGARKHSHQFRVQLTRHIMFIKQKAVTAVCRDRIIEIIINFYFTDSGPEGFPSVPEHNSICGLVPFLWAACWTSWAGSWACTTAWSTRSTAWSTWFTARFARSTAWNTWPATWSTWSTAWNAWSATWSTRTTAWITTGVARTAGTPTAWFAARIAPSVAAGQAEHAHHEQRCTKHFQRSFHLKLLS